MAANNYLLEFDADISKVERKIASLESLGAKAKAQALTQKVNIGGIGTSLGELSDPATAGKVQGTARSLVTQMAGIDSSLGSAAKLAKSVEARFTQLLGPGVTGSQEFLSASKAQAALTTRALRGTAGSAYAEDGAAATQTEALARANATLAGATTAKAVAMEASGAGVRIAENEEALASRKVAEEKTKAAVAANESVIAAKEEALAARRVAESSIKVAVANDENVIAAREQAVVAKTKSSLNDKFTAGAATAEYTAANAEALGAQAAQIRQSKSAVKIETDKNLMAQEALKLQAEEVVQRELKKRALNLAVKEEAAQQGLAFKTSSGGATGQFTEGGGGLFGGIDVGRGFSRAIQYGAPSIALYGAISGIKQMVTEANNLQVQLATIKSQFDFATKSGADFGNISFDKVKQQIIDISKTALQPADVVASVTSQLAGSFADKKGTPDFGPRTLEAVNSSLQLATLTKLPVGEITNGIAAIQLAFQNSLKSVGQFNDLIIGTSNEFGVLSPELVQFVANLAPLGSQMGFTIQQLTGIAGVAQKASGQTGQALSEQLGRILPSLQSKQKELYDALNTTSAGQGVSKSLAGAFGANDIPAVIKTLSDFYGQLNVNQTNAIAKIVGGRREAATFFALLSQNKDLSRVLTPGYGDDFNGAFQKRFSEFSKTIEASLKSLRVNLEAFGLALFNSGLKDGITSLIGGLSGIVQILQEAVKAFGFFNTTLGGVPGKLIVITVAALALAKALKTISETKAVLAALNLVGLGGAGAGAAATGAAVAIPGVAGTVVPAATGAAGGLGSKIGAGFLGTALGGLGTTLGGLGSSGSFIGSAAAGGGALAAAFSLASVAAAGYASFKLVTSVTDLRTQADKQQNEFGDKVKKALESGKSRQEILDTINKTRDKGVLAGLGRAISGSSNEEQAAIDEFQRLDKEKNLAFLQNVANSGKAGSVSGGDVGLNGKDAAKTGKDLINLIKDQLAKNPTSDYWNHAAEELYKRFPEEKAAADAAASAAAANDKAKQAYLDALNAAAKAAEAAAPNTAISGIKFAHGEISAESYLAILDSNIKLLKDEIAAANATGQADPALYTELDKLLKEHDAATSALNIVPLQSAQFLAGIVGNNAETAKAAVATAQKSLEVAVDPASRLKAAQDILTAQQQQWTTFVNAATSAEEKLARTRAGFTLDPNALRVLQASSLQSDVGLQSVSKDVGIDIAQLGLMVSNIINKYGDGTVQTIKALIDAKAAQDIALVNAGAKVNYALVGLGGTPFVENSADIAAQTKAITDKATADKATIDRLVNTTKPLNGKGGGGDPAQNAKDQKAVSDAITNARLDYLLAQIENDPVAAAKNAQAKADAAYRQATDTAGRVKAEADRVRADRTLENALFDVNQSRIDLLIATANAAGNTVKASQLSVQKAQAQLDKVKSTGSGEKATNDAQAALATAQATQRDDTLNKQLSDAQYLHDMKKISDSQLIAIYKSLLASSATLGYTDKEIQDLNLKIRALQQGLGGDKQYNLPTNIDLPTLYQVRRSGQTPGGAGNYQDNRVINIQLNANNSTDAANAAQLIIDQLNRPSRFGNAVIMQ